MARNIILAGVGGQGILSIAFVIDHAALDAGFQFKQSEVHGMAQRGGAVQSHLRYSDRPIHSDLIPKGGADLVLSVEPLEVMRYWHYLGPDGWVVTNVTPYVNIPDYPELDQLLRDLAEFPNIVMVDAGLIAKAAGNLRTQNMALLGAASKLLAFTDDQITKHIERLFDAKGKAIVDVNLRAFRFGQATGRFFPGLIENGVDRLSALALCRKLAPATIDPGYAAAWAEALAGDDNRLTVVLAAEDSLVCAEVPAFG
jgi:indolepyruvate ferredoxin oxidoreductase beta subunit